MKPERRLRILTVCQGETPSTHIRLYDPLGRMARTGRLLWRKAYLASLSRADIDWADLILLQRLDSPVGFDAIEIARLYGKPVIYDTDDNWVDPPPEYHPAYAYHSSVLVRNAVERYLSKADLVTVSTPALAESISRFQERILVVPNTVDFEPPGVPGREGACVRIGYAGTRTHDGDFEVVVPALARLRREFGKRIALVFLGCLPPGLDASEVELWGFCEDYKSYLARLAGLGIHIALAPLRDNRFNRFKSNIKYLEYSLAGAAGVYSRSPAYEGSVQDGVTGLLVPHTEEAWYEAVKSLVQEPFLRKRLATAARRDVEERFPPERTRQAWEKAFSAAGEAAGRNRLRTARPRPHRMRKKVLYIGAGFLWPHTYIDEFLVRAFSSLGLEIAFCPIAPTLFYEQTLPFYSRFDDRFRESTLPRSMEPARLLDAIRSEKPDFLFTLQGYTIPRDILYEISRTGIPSAVWLLDEPYDTLKSADVGTFFSRVFVQDASSVDYHRKFGNPDTHYLPHGFEHLEVHTKQPRPFRWDVSVVGTGFPRRRRALEAIRSAAGSVLVVGSGWPDKFDGAGVEHKPLASPLEAATIYNESRINLNVHREETDFSVSSESFRPVSPNGSVFYVAGCGAFQIADDSRQDLPNLFEPGKEIVLYRDSEELQALVTRYLADEQERTRIAEAGRKRALAQHTYAHRLRKVVEMLEENPLKARPRFFERTEIRTPGVALGSVSASDRVQLISLSTEAEGPHVRSIHAPADADASSCLNEALFQSLAPRAIVALSEEVEIREAACRAEDLFGSNPDLGAVAWRNSRSELALTALSMRILHRTGALAQGYKAAGLALEDLLLRMRASGFEVLEQICPAGSKEIDSSRQTFSSAPEDRERFVRAWGLDPERRLRAKRLLRIARDLRAQRHDELALPVLEQALALDPDWEEAGRELGGFLLYRGEAPQAAPYLAASWSRDPNHINGGLLYGLCLLHLKEEQKALEVLLPLLERKACLLEKTSLLYNIGRCYRRLGEREQALRRLSEAVKWDPSYLRAHQELLSMHVEAQDFSAALECIERIVQIDPKNPEAVNDLGVILHKLGRDREALEVFQKALALDPSYQPAAKNLQIVLAALGTSSPRRSYGSSGPGLEGSVRDESEARQASPWS